LEQWLGSVRFGVPSYQPGEPEFDARRYWRGPVWLVVNWMLIDGLEGNGQVDLAEAVKRHSLELVTRGGFAEYFDPLTGEPLGGQNFSWTAAMTLLLQSL
jgi:glycogen debranching enzyme